MVVPSLQVALPGELEACELYVSSYDTSQLFDVEPRVMAFG
jgi:hypothetical protein